MPAEEVEQVEPGECEAGAACMIKDIMVVASCVIDIMFRFRRQSTEDGT